MGDMRGGAPVGRLRCGLLQHDRLRALVLLEDSFYVPAVVEMDLLVGIARREVVARGRRPLAYWLFGRRRRHDDRLGVEAHFYFVHLALDYVHVQQDGAHHAFQFVEEADFGFESGLEVVNGVFLSLALALLFLFPAAAV